MKLNYKVDFKKDKKEDVIKDETKLSMQNNVLSALASKIPTSNPATMAQAPKQGWGKTV